jgi:hypothetical protein
MRWRAEFFFFSRPTHNRQQVLRVAFLESPKRNSYPCLQLVFIHTYRCVYVYSYVLYLRAIKPGGYRLSLLHASQVIPPSEARNYSNWASLIALFNFPEVQSNRLKTFIFCEITTNVTKLYDIPTFTVSVSHLSACSWINFLECGRPFHEI